MDKEYNNLKVGEKIFYAGDMANLPATGEIVEVYNSKFYPVLYDIALDNGEEKRISKGITPANFKGIGKRFQLESERKAEREEKIKELEKMFA